MKMANDVSVYICVQFDQMLLGLPSRDYYLENTSVKAYHNYMTNVAILLGANPRSAAEEFDRVIALEKQLANVRFHFVNSYFSTVKPCTAIDSNKVFTIPGIIIGNGQTKHLGDLSETNAAGITARGAAIAMARLSTRIHQSADRRGRGGRDIRDAVFRANGSHYRKNGSQVINK